MQQLRFVGVHDDGQHLILETPDGEQRFSAPLDSDLRNAVVKARRAHPARGLSGNGVFGPRDIQTRFRQGASVDEIVAESGWKPERVRRYEWPILAERSHIVAEAKAVAVTPLHAERTAVSTRPSLHELIVAVREDWGFAEGEAQWNSWQREDGQWNVSVSVDYSPAALQQLPDGAEFPARFVYNPANQTVTAANAVAEFLLGREAGAQEGTEQPSPAAPPQDPASPEAGESAAAGQDAAPAEDAAPDSDVTDSDIPDAEATARGGLRTVPEPAQDAQDELLAELQRRRGQAPGADPSSDARVQALTERMGEDAPQESEPPAAEDSRAEGGPTGNRASGAGAQRGSGKRPSVPSWDDIVFGGRH